MALLNLARVGRLLLFLLLFCGGQVSFTFEASAQSAPAPEYRIKAAFLFNFAQFAEWPSNAFTDAKAPLIIGIQ